MAKKLNFTFQECFKSDIAKAYGINNTTSNPEYLNNWMNLVVYCLQPIRDKLGKPMNITGAFRSPKLVEKLKSSTTGHPQCQCADLSVNGMTQEQLFNFIKDMYKNGEIEYDQLIWEKDSNCVHIGYKTTVNRHQTMIRDKINGKYIYTNVDIK